MPTTCTVGVVGGEVFGDRARRALADADVLVGSPRHLERVVPPTGSVADPATGAERVELAGPLLPLFERIAEARDERRRVCVLASGDPGFFGIVRSLASHLGPGAVVAFPAPSSVSLAFASQGWNWDDATVASAHGRDLGPAVAAVAGAAKAAVLTDPTNPPEALGTALLDLLDDAGRERTHLDHGTTPPHREVVVVSRLGEADEAVHRTDLAGLAAGTFDPMSVVLLRAVEPDHTRSPVGGGRGTGTPSDGRPPNAAWIGPAATSSDTLEPGATTASSPTVRWGRPEAEFAHRDGMITKAEVRAIALGKLALPQSGVLWDVGAGSGSVGIEAAAVAPGLSVFAVERSGDDAERIAVNADEHGVAVTVVTGEAPAALAALPDPDRVFIGGGGLDVLDACVARLRPGGTVVATYVLLDRALAAHERLGNLVAVRIDRAAPLAGVGLRLEPLNPVFVCWGHR